MREIIKYTFLVWIGLIISRNPAYPMNKFADKYPYAILGDDFGILNEDDLAINSCIATPVPFPPDLPSYPYWQCFQIKNVTFVCDNAKGVKPNKLTPTALVILAKDDANQHEYISRRAIEHKDCLSFKKDWQRMTRQETYVCLSGGFIGSEDNKKKDWVFDKFKTRKVVPLIFLETVA